METKSDVDWMNVIRDRCDFEESHIVPNDGSSGGLALFWISEIKIQVLSSSMSHIDGVIDEGGISTKWHMTGFYGNSETSRRVESWQLLTSCERPLPRPSFLWDVGPNPREWVESCYCLSKWRFD